jgi:hypothetical protein
MPLAPSPFQIPSDSNKQPAWLHSFIEDATEESSNLEFKRGSVLAFKGQGRQKAIEEFTKDVTAMANAGGGTILFGIEEEKNEAGFDTPSGYAPCKSGHVSREQLDQILSSNIRPPIEGLRIVPIRPLGSTIPGDVCFAIEIPQSDSAHQAADFRYYRRRNTTTDAMPDYEIREVMARRKWPDVGVEIKIRLGDPFQVRDAPKGNLHIQVENLGSVTCRNFVVLVTIPYVIARRMVEFPSDDVLQADTEKGIGLRVSFANGVSGPLLPSLKMIRNYPIYSPANGGSLHLKGDDRSLLEKVQYRLFADEAPVKEGWLDVGDVLNEPSGSFKEFRIS